MIRKIFLTLLAGIILVVAINAAIGYRTKRKLVDYCRATTVGTPLAAARERAVRNGFRVVEGGSPDESRRKVLVTASGVMGRLVCEIEHDGNKVLRSSLRFND